MVENPCQCPFCSMDHERDDGIRVSGIPGSCVIIDDASFVDDRVWDLVSEIKSKAWSSLSASEESE